MMRAKRTVLYVLALAFLPSCVDTTYQFTLHQRTPQESALAALKSGDADFRYKTLVELAKSKAFRDDWAVKAMSVVVRTDPSPSVRALAVHNFGRIGDKRVLADLVDAMDDPETTVRIEASWSLSQFDVPACGADDKIILGARKVLLQGLATDSSLDVRINCAKGLGTFKHRDVLMALVAALRDTDFAVRYESEFSLVRLTGTTFRGNAARWIAWLQDNKDPFKNAGQTPPELALPRKSSLQRTRDALYQFYVDWQGPAKR
jgi:hypothetical protein